MTHLHISVPAITRGTLTRPHELKRANLASKVGFGPFRALSCSVSTLHCLGLICLFIRRNETVTKAVVESCSFSRAATVYGGS